MKSRVTEGERLRHKVLFSLNAEQYEMLLDEARARNLAPSITARLAFAEGLPRTRRKRRAACRRGLTP